MSDTIDTIDSVENEIQIGVNEYGLTFKEAEACIYWLEHKNQLKAYTQAGFKFKDKNVGYVLASRMFGKDKVLKFCHFLLDRVHKARRLKIEWWLYQTEYLAEYARTDRDKVAALGLLQKYYGLDQNLWGALKTLEREGINLEYQDGEWVHIKN